MKTNLTRLWLLLLLYTFLLSGCKDKEGDPDPEPQHNFVSATLAGNLSKDIMQTYAAAFGFGNYTSYLKYDVSFYRLHYKTTFKGQEIEASGLLAIPRGTSAAPALLSAQHGTIFLDTEAPSNFPATFSGFELFAAAGYITVIPDYIGFGASKNIIHPYYDQQHSALAVIDMLKATRHYLETEKIAFNSKLFLLGYSEGGYVTMAAQKEIETNTAHNLTLTAVAAGAGGYDLPEKMLLLANAPSYSNPAFLANLLYAYNNTYNWNRPLSDFFRTQYASLIPGLLNGTKDIGQINAALTDTPMGLLNSTFYQNLTVPTAETILKQKLAENSFLTWAPKSPTRLYHGTHDEAVYFRTSQTTYDRFVAANATNVTLISIPGGTHATSVEPMMLNALQWFNSLNN